MEHKSSIVDRLPTFVTESASLIAETTNYEMQILLFLFFGHQRPSHHFEKGQDKEEPKYEAESRLGALVAGVCGVIWSLSEFGLDVVSVMRGQHIKNGLPTRDPAKEEEDDHDQDDQSGPYETQGSQNGDLTLESHKTKDSQPIVPPSGEPIPIEVVATQKSRRENASAPISSSASQRSLSSILSMQDSNPQQRMRVRDNNDEESQVVLADAETPVEVTLIDDRSNRAPRPSMVVVDNNPSKTGGNEAPLSAADASTVKRTESGRSDTHSDTTEGLSSSNEQGSENNKSKKKKNKNKN